MPSPRRSPPSRQFVRPGRRVAAGLLALSLAACVDRRAAPPVPVIIPPTPVIGRVPVPPDVASRRLKGALFGHADLKPRHAEYLSEFHHPDWGHPALAVFSLYAARGSLVDCLTYPTDGWPLAARLAAEPLAPTDDPALAAYRALPAARRQQDFMLFVQPTHTWGAPEYRTAQGRPVAYVSGYVVHFAPADGGGSNIQILGYASRIKTGAAWYRPRGGDHLGFPYQYDDTWKSVPPSLADRRALLAALVPRAGVEPPA